MEAFSADGSQKDVGSLSNMGQSSTVNAMKTLVPIINKLRDGKGPPFRQQFYSLGYGFGCVVAFSSNALLSELLLL